MTAPVAASALARRRFSAMGTTVEVLTPPAGIDRAAERVAALFMAWEAELSRFRPDSALSRSNRGEAVRSPLLAAVTARGLYWAARTGGLFDPTLGRQIVELGYDRPFSEMDPAGDTDPHPPAVTPPAAQWRHIRLDTRAGTVVLPPGVALDFGGLAKGMAVDAALRELAAAGLTPALVNAGGDLAVAGVPPSGAWPVAVGEDGGPVVALSRGALATSGVSRRTWRRGGRTWHHVLDPRTGLSADTGILAVTVAAATCEEAEVAAKTALLLGPDAAVRFIERAGLAARLVLADHIVTTARWPAPRLTSEQKGPTDA